MEIMVADANTAVLRPAQTVEEGASLGKMENIIT